MASDSVALSTVFADLKIQIGSHSHSHKKSPYSIICDAWYGFPTQKRPRKERILAVSKQIHNFNTWRATRNANFTNEKNAHAHAHAHAPISNVYVIGSVDDVNSIRDRVQALNGVSDCDDNADSDEETKVQVATATATATATTCMFMPGMKLEDLSKELSKTIQVEVSHSEAETGTGTGTPGTETGTSSKKFISYLSPDADFKLKASQIPPQIVIVGMLVDRKVQPNRSRKRAESLLARNGNGNGKQTARTSTSTFSCSENPNPNVNGGEEEEDDETQMIPILPTQLPLDALNVQELSADEPLNIDTVMEILERWWQHSHNEDRIGSETQRVRNFKDAAARALLTHRQRHPNRVVHGGASKMG